MKTERAPEDIHELMAEQLSYYRFGAREYDEANHQLLAAGGDDGDTRRLVYRRAAEIFKDLTTDRDVLEVAGGTGMYTQLLAACAGRLTVVDASPESLAINRMANADASIDIEYVVSDVFTWRPPRRFEVVVFAFWLSHVPIARFDDFWRLVDDFLEPGGTVVLLDAEARPGWPRPAAQVESFFSEEREGSEMSLRSLADGSKFRIVRILWDRRELTDRLALAGWRIAFDAACPWLLGVVQRTPKVGSEQRPGREASA